MTRPEGWIDRRRIELKRKAASLSDEFTVWRTRAAAKAPPGPAQADLRAHHSQIDMTTAELQVVADRLGAIIDGDKLEDRADDVAATILDLHRVWGFFRGKLLLREDELFRLFLHTADQLAWECWHRAIDGAIEGGAKARRRPPPLVYLNGARMPFMMSRDEMYQPEPVPGAPITREELVKILRSLPVPVIGVPWSAVKHVPDALAIAHEVGHVVEEDLHLMPAIKSAVEGVVADSARRDAWTSWAGELFADIFAIAAVGPSFFGLLADTLASDPGVIALERQVTACWGLYPTTWLRVACAAAAIEAFAWPDDVAGSWRRHDAAWRARYPAHAMTDFNSDVEQVVGAIVKAKYTGLGSKTLKESLSTPIHAARLTSNAILQKGAAILSNDARAVVAGARLAFEENPAEYETLDGHGRALQHLDACWQIRGTIRSTPVGNVTSSAPGSLFDALTVHWAREP